MRTFSQLALILFAAAACGSSSARPATHPTGYAARMEAADEHSRRAEDLRQAARAPHSSNAPHATNSPYAAPNPDDYQCGDRDMSDQLTSGGERLVPQMPCWDPVEELAERHRVAAAREDQQARNERRAATKLVEAELAACRGISPHEVDHSPFAHRRAIAEVVPHSEGGAVRGVRVVFKPVLGLTAAWMEKAIACHRARFERLGEPPTYLSDDPTLVPGATATVTARAGRIEVLIETRNDVAAHVALGRAQDLVRSRTAGR
jgi:hypothetical protein